MLQIMRNKETRKVPKLKEILNNAIARTQKEQSEKRKQKLDPNFEINVLRGSSKPKMALTNFDMARDQLNKVFRTLDTNKINLDLLRTKIYKALRPISPRLKNAMRQRHRLKTKSETRQSHLMSNLALQK